MTCKCGARSRKGHPAKIEAGYSAHAYHGFVYGPVDNDLDKTQETHDG